MGRNEPYRLPPKPGIVFMGTPHFALPSLDALAAHGHRVRAVVTQPDRPRGRSKKRVASPVKQAAKRLGIEILQPERASDPSFCRVIRDVSPDILVVIAFGQVLTPEFLDIPRWGGLNIHASLLPKYRGAAPIQRAVINGESETGLTAMRMAKGLDTGPILLQEKTPIGVHETAGELHDRLSDLSAPFLLRTLQLLGRNEIHEMTQDDARATRAAKIDRTTGHISWDRSAENISSLIRGLDPWPGAHTTIEGRTLKLFSCRVANPADTDTVPGRIKDRSDEGLLVETGNGVILVKELQLAGKKRMPTADFLRGYSLSPETLLGT